MSESTKEIFNERLWIIDIDISLCIAHRVVDSGHHDFRGISSSFDFEESMRVIFGLLTLLTVIKVFANATLVANSSNWSDSTSIALNAFMNLIGIHGFIEWIECLLFGGAINLI